MARRRGRTIRTRARRSYFRMGARRRGRSSQKLDLGQLAIAAGAYGVVRNPIANALGPVTDFLPLGDYKDEVVMGAVSFAAAKWGKGLIKNIGKAGLTYELASAGMQLSSGLMGGDSKSSTVQFG
jgi:hypothetical protein